MKLAEREVVGLDARTRLHDQCSHPGRSCLVKGVEPGRTADVDGNGGLAVGRDAKRASAAEHQVDLARQEAELKLGPRAGGGLLRVVGPRAGQAKTAKRQVRWEMVKGR